MRYLTLSRVLKGLLVLGFGLAVMSQSVEAKTRPIVVTNSVDRGNHVVINAGSKWKSKSVVLEVGVKPKSAKTWKWSRIGTSRTDVRGATHVCSSRTLMKGNQLRVRVGKVEIAKVNISRNITLSGCGYVAPSAPSITASPAIAVTTPTASSPATTPTQSVATTVPPTTAPPTTAPPTTAPPTTAPPVTTLPPSTPAPTALVLSSVSDTGDSQSDGITNATTLVVEGSAEVNSSVQVYVNGTASGSSCTANGSGVFACTLGTLSEGNHAITARATANALESSSSATYNIVVDRTAPTATIVPAAATANSGERTTVTVTVSENTTTLIESSVNLNCVNWLAGGLCDIDQFTGSGREYSFSFRLLRDQNNGLASGGVFRLYANAYSDIAGNAHSVTAVASVGYDYMGPQPTFTRQLQTITVTFNEVPVDFTVNSLTLLVFYYDQYQFAETGTQIFRNFAPFGSSGRVWTFTFAQNIIDARFPTEINDSPGMWYKIQIAPLHDTDGNTEGNQDFFIP